MAKITIEVGDNEPMVLLNVLDAEGETIQDKSVAVEAGASGSVEVDFEAGESIEVVDVQGEELEDGEETTKEE